MSIKTEIKEIALAFVESTDMVEYLRSMDKGVPYWIEIISCSRSSLEGKARAIRLVSDKLKEGNNPSEDLAKNKRGVEGKSRIGKG